METLGSILADAVVEALTVVPVHSLASLTWPAVRDLPAARTVAVLPAGAIEAHGPHLPLSTDVIIAEAMARAGAARLAARGLHVLLLPAMTVAPAPFASEFAGTLHVPAETTTMVVTGIVQSLAAHGIRVTAIANAHHDPAHVSALRRAASGSHDDEADGCVPGSDEAPVGRDADAGIPQRRVSRRTV